MVEQDNGIFQYISTILSTNGKHPDLINMFVKALQDRDHVIQSELKFKEVLSELKSSEEESAAENFFQTYCTYKNKKGLKVINPKGIIEEVKKMI